MGNALSLMGSIGMAVGPPLAYADQYYSVVKNRTSEGFSTDVCGILIVANITRVFYWIGARFETPLLIQSLLMICAQFALLYVCLLYRPRDDETSREEEELLTGNGSMSKEKKSYRIGKLWQWPTFMSYIEFSALLIAFHCVTFLILHSFATYVTALGFIALGLEATLPIPQLLVNHHSKSTAGFRTSVLLGWLGGDSFKTIYFFITTGNSIAFKSCAIFQLSIDVLILIQTILYRAKTKEDLSYRTTSGVEGVAGPEDVIGEGHH